MIEILGFRYGVGRRTAATTYCLTVTAGLSYSLFIARFALPWFGVRSSDLLRLTESGSLAFAMTSVLMATGIMCALMSATKQPVAKSADEEEETRPIPRWRLSWDAAAWLDVEPLSMGLTVCALTQVLHWSSGSALFNVLACAIAILMVSHVRSLWHAAQRLRTDDSSCRLVDHDQLDTFDDKRLPTSRWKPPTEIDGAAEADDYARRARRSRNGLIVTAVGAMSFIVLMALAALGRSVDAIAHDLAQTDFLQFWGIPTGAAITLALVGACQARSSEMTSLARLYTAHGERLSQRSSG